MINQYTLNKIVVLLLLFIVVSPKLLAQQPSEMRVVDGSAKFLPEELIDKSTRDKNGEVCAGLMILSDLEGLSFTSYNGIVKVNELPGKYFLFLSPDERVVEVYKTGFMTLKIILRDHGIKLASGQTWQLQITSEKKYDLIPITILAEPAEANIFIDDINKGVNTTQQVTAGKHVLRVEKKGYVTRIDTIFVSTDNVLFKERLRETETVAVQIKTDPQGAKIFIDGVEKGETNRGLFLLPGKSQLKLIKSGYAIIDTTIDIKTDTNNEFRISLTMVGGTLALKLNPEDVNIMIGKDDYSGQTQIVLVPGNYKLVLQKSGYESITDNFEIKKGETLTLPYSLIAKTGNLQFNVTPLEAEVILTKEGKHIRSWTGMQTIKNIQVGEYSIRCTCSGYAVLDQVISIEENKTEYLDIKMKKSEQIVPRPVDDNLNTKNEDDRELFFGIKGGVIYAALIPDPNLPGEFKKVQDKTGLVGGVNLLYAFSKNFWLQSELLYGRAGEEFNYFDLPLLLRIRIYDKIFVFGGTSLLGSSLSIGITYGKSGLIVDTRATAVHQGLALALMVGYNF